MSDAVIRDFRSNPQITQGTAAPTTGTWVRGDICWRSDATTGETPGWICTAGGSPGTWKAMANVA